MQTTIKTGDFALGNAHGRCLKVAGPIGAWQRFILRKSGSGMKPASEYAARRGDFSPKTSCRLLNFTTEVEYLISGFSWTALFRQKIQYFPLHNICNWFDGVLHLDGDVWTHLNLNSE